MKRLVIVTEIISPYRIPLFNALARRNDINLHVIFLAETDPVLRQWPVYKKEIDFSYAVLPSWRPHIGSHRMLLNWGLGDALQTAAPDVILCGGYNYIASWRALQWARQQDIPFLLWSESTSHDLRGGRPWVELAKSKFLRLCTGFVVPGVLAREYLISRGHEERTIFIAPNAVDNELFARGARLAQLDAARSRKELDLPPRYFLFVGRLVREKGVFDLLSAYAGLSESVRTEVGLVFAGDGVERSRLEQQARLISPGQIGFPGFVHREQLAALYGLADAMILPTYTETWGLVVNEAMACGLPVLVSSAAGCTADLVKNHWNGRSIPPADVDLLRESLQSLAENSDLRRAMGARSADHIVNYSPQSWCLGVVSAVEQLGAVC